MTARKRSASVGMMEDLHMMVCQYMKDRLENSKPDPDAEPEIDPETGEEVPQLFIPLASAELQVIVGFLKNNDITATPDSAALGQLQAEFDKELSDARNAKADALIQSSTTDERAGWFS